MADSTMYDAFLELARKGHSRSPIPTGKEAAMTTQTTKPLRRAQYRRPPRDRDPWSVQVLRTYQALDGLDLTVAPGDVHRLPRAERCGQVHHHPRTARPVARRRRRGPTARRRSLARRGGIAPPDRLRARRRDVVAEPHRPADHRLPGPPARQRSRHPPPRSADRTVRTRPAQEGPHLFEGQPAEGVRSLPRSPPTPSSTSSTSRPRAWTP